MARPRVMTAGVCVAPSRQREVSAVRTYQGPQALPLAINGEAAPLLRRAIAAAGMALGEFWETDLRLISLSGGAERAWALNSDQTTPGMSWYENLYPPDRATLHAYVAQQREANPVASVDYRVIVGDGELLWVRHWTVHRTIQRGRARMVSALMPIPEQKHLEWECLRVSERECNRIGQELHDDLCQVLAGLAFMLQVIETRALKVDRTLAAELAELNTHLAGATDRVRSMAHGLFPARLNFATLEAALTNFATQMRTLFRIEVALSLPRRLPAHESDQLVHVYRIAQEAVSNAVRHGHATRVDVAVSHRQGQITLRITDNGSGFLAAHARPEGIGMHVMQYRAHALGGTIAIQPQSPSGVAISLSYPTRNPHSRSAETSLLS